MMRLHKSLLACGLILLMACPVWAQQQIASISALKAQIKQMEVVERDPSTPSDVKTMNREFLKTRRNLLRDLATKRIESLRKYRENVGASLTPEESKSLETSIHDLAETLRELKQELAVSDSDVAAANQMPATQTSQPVEPGDATGKSLTLRSIESEAVSAVPASPVAETNSMSLAPQLPDCYSDAPVRLEKAAEATAIKITGQVSQAAAAGKTLDDDETLEAINEEFESHYNELAYLTVADALFTSDSKDKMQLRKLTFQEFSAETARTDKQIGASARSSGSTSVAEKPSFSDLLSFAIEHGAIQKEVSGTSLTLSSSPYALIAAVKGDTSDIYRQYDFFNRIGLSANFNIDNQDNVLASATRRQLNEWSAKFRLNSDHTARGAEFSKFWKEEIRPLIERRAIVLVAGFDEAFNKVEYLRKLRKSVRDKFEGAPGFLVTTLKANTSRSQPEQVASIKQEILCRLKSEVYEPVKAQGLDKIDQAFRDFLNQSIADLANAQLAAEEGRAAVKAKLKELAGKPTSSFAYTNMRPAAGSTYSVFKLMYEQAAFNPMKILANAGVSMYHNPDRAMNQQRIRDVALALSFNGSVARSPFVTTDMDESQITYSFAGRYQRMMENRHVAGKKADIAAAQFKLEIPLFTALSLPLSITYTNATEEGKHDHVRFNFGFNFDADKLAALFRAKRQ